MRCSTTLWRRSCLLLISLLALCKPVELPCPAHALRFPLPAVAHTHSLHAAERVAEDRELDRLPMMVNNFIGADILPRARWGAAVPAAAAFAMGALFMIPRAFTMRGLDKHYISAPKRVAVVGVGGLLGMAGIAAVSVAGPLIYGKRAPFRFASS